MEPRDGSLAVAGDGRRGLCYVTARQRAACPKMAAKQAFFRHGTRENPATPLGSKWRQRYFKGLTHDLATGCHRFVGAAGYTGHHAPGTARPNARTARRIRARAERVHPCGPRWRSGRSQSRHRPSGGWRPAWPAGRDPRVGEGQYIRGGSARPMGQPAVPGSRARSRRHLRGTAAGGGRRHHRQDHHAGIRPDGPHP